MPKKLQKPERPNITNTEAIVASKYTTMLDTVDMILQEKDIKLQDPSIVILHDQLQSRRNACQEAIVAKGKDEADAKEVLNYIDKKYRYSIRNAYHKQFGGKGKTDAEIDREIDRLYVDALGEYFLSSSTIKDRAIELLQKQIDTYKDNFISTSDKERRVAFWDMTKVLKEDIQQNNLRKTSQSTIQPVPKKEDEGPSAQLANQPIASIQTRIVNMQTVINTRMQQTVFSKEGLGNLRAGIQAEVAALKGTKEVVDQIYKNVDKTFLNVIVQRSKDSRLKNDSKQDISTALCNAIKNYESVFFADKRDKSTDRYKAFQKQANVITDGQAYPGILKRFVAAVKEVAGKILKAIAFGKKEHVTQEHKPAAAKAQQEATQNSEERIKTVLINPKQLKEMLDREQAGALASEAQQEIANRERNNNLRGMKKTETGTVILKPEQVQKSFEEEKGQDTQNQVRHVHWGKNSERQIESTKQIEQPKPRPRPPVPPRQQKLPEVQVTKPVEQPNKPPRPTAPKPHPTKAPSEALEDRRKMVRTLVEKGQQKPAERNGTDTPKLGGR